mmetsp:Transcript_79105/g.177219  ORF Transcript_79105/g.177219 Transcript_79105/m.177219 type:complete len:280 (+) Transcript_79105:208-1047(+)
MHKLGDRRRGHRPVVHEGSTSALGLHHYRRKGGHVELTLDPFPVLPRIDVRHQESALELRCDIGHHRPILRHHGLETIVLLVWIEQGPDEALLTVEVPLVCLVIDATKEGHDVVLQKIHDGGIVPNAGQKGDGGLVSVSELHCHTRGILHEVPLARRLVFPADALEALQNARCAEENTRLHTLRPTRLLALVEDSEVQRRCLAAALSRLFRVALLHPVDPCREAGVIVVMHLAHEHRTQHGGADQSRRPTHPWEEAAGEAAQRCCCPGGGLEAPGLSLL